MGATAVGEGTRCGRTVMGGVYVRQSGTCMMHSYSTESEGVYRGDARRWKVCVTRAGLQAVAEGRLV